MNRKESACPLAPDVHRLSPNPRTLDLHVVYPFAVVLRLRVLQIVCGISVLIMGTVAFIEEKATMNLALGIPAGLLTVLAASFSIYTSRGFGGYRASSCDPNSPFRFLGPSFRIGLPLGLLWGVTCSFQLLLLTQCVRTFAQQNITTTARVLTIVEASLGVAILLAVACVVNIDCRYNPDGPGYIHEQHDSGTSTRLSLVPIPSSSSEIKNNSRRVSNTEVI